MEFDVIIVGGGLAGASLAVALRTAQRKVALVESRPPVRPAVWDQRLYAVSPASRAFLSRIGAWENFDPQRLCSVPAMEVYGDAAGKLRFSAYEAGVAELAVIAESSTMLLELWESLKRQHNVSVFCPDSPSELELGAEGASLQLASGRRLDGRLIVAADGAQSWVRERAGIEARFAPYGEFGVVANFSCEQAHDAIARQWFREDGILAWLPLPGRRVSMVWSTPEEHAQSLLGLDEAELGEKVAAAGGHALGNMTAEGTAAAFPLQLMRVTETVRPRLALIGDAAHVIHPLSGHGINLGFMDAEALARHITQLPLWRDPGELPVLRAYARERAEEPALLQGVTHGLNRLFNTSDPLLRWARNCGMNLTDKLPVVRSALVRYATSGRF